MLNFNVSLGTSQLVHEKHRGNSTWLMMNVQCVPVCARFAAESIVFFKFRYSNEQLLIVLRQKKYMKLLQLWYKSWKILNRWQMNFHVTNWQEIGTIWIQKFKIFDLSEFLFKVYEVDTIWIQIIWKGYNLDTKFGKFLTYEFPLKVYENDTTWIQKFKNFEENIENL